MSVPVVTITPEVFQIGGPGITDAEDAAVYLVAIGDHAALIDAGCGRTVDRLLANVTACGVGHAGLEDLLLTHCHFDHTGGAAELQARLALRVVIHALDAPYVEAADPAVTAAAWYGAALQSFRPDRLLEGATEDLWLGGRRIQAIHVPGHSPGSVVYLLESGDRRILFGQDVHGPLHPTLKSDPVAYRHSLQRLIDLEADILCEGHFGIIEGPGRVNRFIRQYLA
jgi:glyoxylase-like metal-dependent hydrolase (beta-lactamase superfamily II)